MQNECDVICVQKSYRDQNSIRLKILNRKLVSERPHNKYRNKIFVRKDLKIFSTDYINHDDKEILNIELTNCTITLIYKLSGIPFKVTKLKCFDY